MCRKLLVVTLVSVLGLPGSIPGAHAHEYEPINTEFAPPVEDIVFDLTGSGFDEDEATLFTLPGFVFEAPISDRMQLEVGLPVLSVDPDRGDGDTNLGDLELGLRYQLVPEDRQGRMPDLDLNFELGTPTGDREAGLGGEAWESAVGLFLTKHAGGGTILFGNFSYAAEIPREGEAERENLLEFATAAVHPLTDRIHPTVELFGEWNATEGETELFAAPEVIFALGRGWEVKAAVPLGLTDSSPDVGVQVQFTYMLDLARHSSDHSGESGATPSPAAPGFRR